MLYPFLCLQFVLHVQPTLPSWCDHHNVQSISYEVRRNVIFVILIYPFDPNETESISYVSHYLARFTSSGW
jgi:hypothetical protein